MKPEHDIVDKDTRRAITFIELLIVTAIIAILISLLIPAVQRVRSAAARAQCASNLRQIGIAVHHFHDTNKVLPTGMRLQNFKDPYRMASWLAQILPFLDQQELWTETQAAYLQSANPFRNPPHTGLSTVVHLFACPTDWRANQVQTAERTRTRVALTSYLGVSGKDLTTRDGILFRDSRVCMAEITDGTSTTLLAGERPPSMDFQFGWWYAGAGQKFSGSGDMLLGVEEQNILPITVGSCAPGAYRYGPGAVIDQCDMFHFWSLHAGGAHFLFADGTVRFLSYSAAPIMPALASRAGGETVELPD